MHCLIQCVIIPHKEPSNKRPQCSFLRWGNQGSPRLNNTPEGQTDIPKLWTQTHALNLGCTFRMYHDYQQVLKTATTPPNCSGIPTNFTGEINDYLLFSTTCVPTHESLAHPVPPLTSNNPQYLPGTGFKAMRIFTSAFLFKGSPSLQDTIQFQNCCDQRLHGARGPIISGKPPGPRTLLPPAAVYTRLIIPQPPVLFSGQEIRTTWLTEMPLSVRESLVHSRNLEVRFFILHSGNFSFFQDVLKSVSKTAFRPRLNKQAVCPSRGADENFQMNKV